MTTGRHVNRQKRIVTHPMDRELAASYQAARAIARSRARNFYYSFVVLPVDKRRALCALYAFMRQCDDISDGPAPADRKREMLSAWRRRLEEGLRGNCRDSEIFPAFVDSVRSFSIPAEYFHRIIDGAEMDLTVHRYETFDDLYRYCYNVASAVGLACLHVFGFKDECAKVYAEQCGIAFQLTNILRDLKEDAEMGRIYLPEEDLDRFQYSADDLRGGIKDQRFRRLMTFEANRARQYYGQGRRLLPLVDAGSKPALWAMMEIYSRLLEKIVRRDYDVFDTAIRLSGSEKASIALMALAMRLMPPRAVLRSQP